MRKRPFVFPRWLWTPLGIFVITRLGVALIAYLSVPLIPFSDPPPYHLRPPDNVLFDVLGSRWDTGFYVSIVEEGYRYEGVTLPSVAFFPMLPLWMAVLLPLVGDAVVAGVVVSNGALLLATLCFYRLVADEWGEGVAGRATWYLLIFPASFFGSAIYTESLFLLGAVGALWAGRNGRWVIAALLGIMCCATRLVGIIVVPLLLLEWWQQHRPWWTGVAPLLPPLGTVGYMGYLWYRFADPLAFVKAAAAWERVPQAPGVTIGRLLQMPEEGWKTAVFAARLPLNDWLDLLFVLTFLLLGFVLLYQHRWSEGVFVWLGVMIPFSSGLLMSQRRYVWVLFPVFILLARWGERPWVDRGITAVSLLLLALFTALFANGYWVG